ncbi:hypothetical protein D9M70_529610 [compost metagenome]
MPWNQILSVTSCRCPIHHVLTIAKDSHTTAKIIILTINTSSDLPRQTYEKCGTWALAHRAYVGRSRCRPLRRYASTFPLAGRCPA